MRGDAFVRNTRIMALSIVLAVAFGVLHDSIDVHISPDFYRIFKGALDSVPLPLWAIYVACQASWWVGALIGVGLCVAANKGPWPLAPLPTVYRWMAVPVACAAVGSLAGAVVGHDALVGFIEAYEREVTALPRVARVRVSTVEGMHEGVYLGGATGGVVAWRGVYRSRYSLKRRQPR